MMRFKKCTTFIIVFLLFLFFHKISFAISNAYNPGETLNPDCAPGTKDCTVNISNVSSVWSSLDGDVFYNTGRVGIWTDNPDSSLTLKSSYKIIGSELVSNGTFNENANGWDLHDIGQFNGDHLSVYYAGDVSYNNLSTTIETESGKTYLISFKLSELSDTSVFVKTEHNSFIEAEKHNIDGIYSVLFTADYTGTDTLYFEGTGYSPSYWSLDDVSVKEVELYTAFSVFDLSGNKIFSLGGIVNQSQDTLFIGNDAGIYSTNAKYSNFIGSNAGNNAINAQYSNFIGNSVGTGATDSIHSNFIGTDTGDGATTAEYSNFIGFNAGSGATDAWRSNFMGFKAGSGATGAHTSIFLGENAGLNSYDSYLSIFIGQNAGSNFSSDGFSAWNSIFLGNGTGSNANYANDSIFMGYYAGSGAANASKSIFIGQNAGKDDIVNNTGDTDDFSILLGPSTSTGGFSNSIALGGYATNTATNQLMIGSTTRPINTTIWNTAGGTTCTLTSAGLTCTSDENLKTNITDLDTDTLDKLTKLRTVRFNWLDYQEGDKQNIGFLAQNLETEFPELVSVDINGHKSVNYANMTPILTEAVRELDLKVASIDNLDEENTWRDGLISWLSNTENKITDFFAKVIHSERVETKELCVGSTCVTESQFLQMVQNASVSVSSSSESVGGIKPETISEKPVQDEANKIEETETQNLTPISIGQDSNIDISVKDTSSITESVTPYGSETQ